MPLRSMLFVPGDQPRRIAKAFNELPADAAILDLEDAVAISAKPATRAPVAEALGLPGRDGGPRRYVRVNSASTPWFFGDLDAVVRPGLDGVMLPKCAGPEEVAIADAYLTHLERERDLALGSIELLPLIESASGGASLREICQRARQTQTGPDTSLTQSGPDSGAHAGQTAFEPGSRSRVRRLGFGATDYTTDLGSTWTDDETALLLICSQLVLYSREAGLDPPIDTVYPLFRDPEGYEARCRRSRALGFGGRMCIHPDQLEPTNRIYRPTEEELSWARDVIAGFEEAEAKGVAALTVRGQLVDYAFVVRARRLLEQAGEQA